MSVMYSVKIPWLSVILRRAFGVAGAAFVDRGDPDLRVAWPSGDWGSLPLEGGIEAAYKRQFENSSDPDKLRSEVNIFNIDKIVYPFFFSFFS